MDEKIPSFRLLQRVKNTKKGEGSLVLGKGGRQAESGGNGKIYLKKFNSSII